MEITKMTIENYEEVYSLWESSEGVGLSSADSKKSIEFYLERNPGMSFVAKENGRIKGSILCGHDGRRGLIHHLAVQDEYRNRGVAKSLVERSLKSLEEIDIKKCHIFIYVDNIAKGFWESIGWNYRDDIGVMSYNL